MSLTYTWQLTGVKIKNQGSYTDVVVQTYWTKTGTDQQGNTGIFSGATAFTRENSESDSDFVPYQDLNEEIVLGWIQDVVTGQYQQHVDSEIQRQIDQKINNEISNPWDSKPVPVVNQDTM